MNTPNINPSITQTHPHRNLPLIQRQENADPEKYTMCIQNPFLDLVHERFNLNAAGVPQRVGDNPLWYPIQWVSRSDEKTILNFFY